MRSSLDDRIRLLDEKLAAVTASLDMHSQAIGARRPEDDEEEEKEGAYDGDMSFTVVASTKQSAGARSTRSARSAHGGIFDGPATSSVTMDVDEDNDEEADNDGISELAQESAEYLIRGNAMQEQRVNAQPTSSAVASQARIQSLVDELNLVREELDAKRSKVADMQKENEELRYKLKRIDTNVSATKEAKLATAERVDESPVESAPSALSAGHGDKIEFPGENAEVLRERLENTERELKSNVARLESLELRNNELVQQLEEASEKRTKDSLAMDMELKSALKELQKERDRVTGISEENKILHESLLEEQERFKETMQHHEENVTALEEKEEKLRELDRRQSFSLETLFGVIQFD